MDNLIIVRGGGDIATGTIYKLYQCGYRVLVLETEKPSAIRRLVAFSEAVYKGSQTVEGVTCILAHDMAKATQLLEENQLVMLIDPVGSCINKLKPAAVVDGILAKKNLGTHRNMADITIALGPGFEAGEDVDAVIETMRGHTLGKVIYEGCALANTGIPGKIGGYDKERVIHAPASGILRTVREITDIVKKGDVIAQIEMTDPLSESTACTAGVIPIYAPIDGLLRGVIRDGYHVTKGFKIADIDPRVQEYDNCFTISDKARCIAGGVLEALMHLQSVRTK